MKILVTGAAGFIGAALLKKLALEGHDVVGIDNINDYYDVELKYGRLEENGFSRPFISNTICRSSVFPTARFQKTDICNKEVIDTLFAMEHFDKVVHLAAQAGVRYSITNPYAYLKSNLEGFLNILEACRNDGTQHLVFASSSSVYGMNSKVPFSEEDQVDNPVSLYAATKKSDELMAYTYSKLYGTAVTGLRYFTVYGPWGRPDMAPIRFAEAISEGKPIEVYNNGDMYRDFTYIDDIVEGTFQALMNTPGTFDGVRYRIYNIGCSSPVKLMDFISELENALGKKAMMNMLPMQPGDVYKTYADTTRISSELGYAPSTPLHEGIRRFASWYNKYKQQTDR